MSIQPLIDKTPKRIVRLNSSSCAHLPQASFRIRYRAVQPENATVVLGIVGRVKVCNGGEALAPINATCVPAQIGLTCKFDPPVVGPDRKRHGVAEPESQKSLLVSGVEARREGPVAAGRNEAPKLIMMAIDVAPPSPDPSPHQGRRYSSS